MSNSRLSVSVISCAYNESRNLPGFLDAVLSSAGETFDLTQVVVVSTGSTDDTDQILQGYRARDPRVVHVGGFHREGKVAALKEGLALATGEILFVVNADTLPSPGMIGSACEEFLTSDCQLVCCRPVPVVEMPNRIEVLGQTLWGLHDRLSRISPKASEAYAIRKELVPEFRTMLEDDDIILALMVVEGRIRARYRSDAVVWIKPASSLSDFISQRLRINRQIARIWRARRMVPRTWNLSHIVTVLKSGPRRPSDGRLLSLLLLATLEGSIRIWALGETYVLGGQDVTWSSIQSTKAALVPPKPETER